ncbi:hypothetical protein GALL_470040 [mine drainage metagenome]|uniref:Uncharacterized protein n=1 Tax=mine drainage metagenome TaxID=410659 RepID=A0A1J5PJL5_9ZZZZ
MNEKHEMLSEFLKFSRLVLMNRPVNSFLSENAMAWTRKSILPQRAFNSAKAASSEVSSVTSTSTRKSEPSEAASGSTRLPNASP